MEFFFKRANVDLKYLKNTVHIQHYQDGPEPERLLYRYMRLVEPSLLLFQLLSYS